MKVQGRQRLPLASRNSPYQVIGDENDDRADHRNEHAPEVKAGDPGSAEMLEQPAADHAPNDPEQNVQEKALAAALYDLARDETGDQPQNDPAEDRHLVALCNRPGLEPSSAVPNQH